jgi:hypothetical protein
MGFTPNFNKSQIKKDLQKALKNMKKAIELRLLRAGEEFLILARESGEYKDHTGNLRNAPFYIVLLDGRPIMKEFGTGEAANISKDFAEKIAAGYTSGYALICGDGMEYAAAVESKGKDVITGSTQIIEGKLKDALKRITQPSPHS